MNKVPMTVAGAEKLSAELKNLKQVKRPQVITAIAEARAHGDLKENAEYHEARRQQSFIEGRILELEGKLANAQVIDVTKMGSSDKVIFGATVHLVNLETGEKVVYQIVGDDESELKLGRISISSPIARALVGKFVDDIVEVSTPNGVIEYELKEVLLI